MAPVDQAELHNRLAGHIVEAIVRPVITSGGGPRETLVLLESVMLGVCLFLQRMNALDVEPDALVDAVAQGLKQRWAEQRLQLRRELN